MSRQNVEIVRAALTAWVEGSFDPELFAEDVEWQAAPDEPDADVARGRQAVYKAVTGWFDHLGPARLEIEQLMDAGDQVLVCGRVYPEGASVGFRGYYVVTVADGRIARVRAFLRRDQAMAVAGLSEQDAHTGDARQM